MSYQALATDYDGTIATEGKVKQTTIAALFRWQETGRKLIMVTGRRLEVLYTIFPEAQSFDCIVAENGALLSFPATGKTTLLGEPVPQSLIKALQKRQVEPLAVGQGIVSTLIPHATIATEVIAELGLSWQISYNKGAVMLLPEGVDKYCGLTKSLEQMNLSGEAVVGVGDGENDIPLLNLCGLAVAVNNALPVLKEISHHVTRYDSGDGVVELIEQLLQS